MPKVKLKDYSLYLIISREYAPLKDPLEIAGSAILAGVDIVQMRRKDLSRGGLLELGKRLRALCRSKNAAFIVNDDPLIAKEVDADGVHMGQEDIAVLPLDRVRSLIGPDKLIGVSTHSLEEFKSAQEQDTDYLAFGPVFPTQTKNYFLGTEQIKPVLAIARKPVFFIGGIDLSNVGVLLGMGVKNIAVIRGILQAEDIFARTRLFKEKIISSREVV